MDRQEILVDTTTDPTINTPTDGAYRHSYYEAAPSEPQKHQKQSWLKAVLGSKRTNGSSNPKKLSKTLSRSKPQDHDVEGDLLGPLPRISLPVPLRPAAIPPSPSSPIPPRGPRSSILEPVAYVEEDPLVKLSELEAQTVPNAELVRQLAAKDAALRDALAGQAQLRRELEDATGKNFCLSILSDEQARDIRELRESSADLQKCLDDQTEEMKALEALLEEETAKVTKCRSQADDHRLEVLKMKDKLADTELNVRKLEEQNKVLQREVAAMKTTLNQKLTRIVALREQSQESRLRTVVTRARGENPKDPEDGWEWGIMFHKLARAEKALRVLDNASRFKIYARLDFPSTKPKKQPPSTLAAKNVGLPTIIGALKDLNEQITNASSTLRSFARPTTRSNLGDMAVGEAVLGARAGLLRPLRAAHQTLGQNKPGWQFFLRIALEMFFASWSVDIIEGNYPPRSSFADFLIDACADPGHSRRGNKPYVPQPICGIQTNVIPPKDATPYTTWVEDVIAELKCIPDVAGVYFNTSSSTPAAGQNADSIILDLITPIIKSAYELRLGLAEKDNLRGLELSVVSPGTVFQLGLMENTHVHHVLGFQMSPPVVLGMTGLGLQRDGAYGPGGWNRMSMDRDLWDDILVKPKVVVWRPDRSTLNAREGSLSKLATSEPVIVP